MTSQLFQSSHIIITRAYTVWKYSLLSFQAGDTKLERLLSKNQHAQMKFMSCENWYNGELSKIGHHFSNIKPDFRNDVIKKCQ
jgi:hypothetical protein